jgi:MFS family permease
MNQNSIFEMASCIALSAVRWYGVNMKKGVSASIAAIGVFCLTTGLTYPLLAYLLEGMGVNTGLIGLNAAMTPLGIIVSSPFIPPLARRFGAWFLCVFSLCMAAVLLLLLAVFRDVTIWFGLRFLLGIANSIIFITSEAWINQLAEPGIRGRIIGLYGTIAAAGFALGPLALAVIGSQGWLPFMVGIVGILLALPIVILAKDHLPEFNGKEKVSVFSFFSMAPLLLLAVTAAALFDQVVMSLLPIYSLRHAIPEATGSLMLTVIIVGNVLLQIPIGWLADRFSRRYLLSWLAFGTVAGCVFLPLWIEGSILIWPMLFFWGAIAFGTYTVAMVDLGARFSGALLLAGNSAFGVMWGIGGIIGPSVAGVTMDQLGPEGLPLTLGVLFGVLGIAALLMPLGQLKSQQIFSKS